MLLWRKLFIIVIFNLQFLFLEDCEGFSIYVLSAVQRPPALLRSIERFLQDWGENDLSPQFQCNLCRSTSTHIAVAQESCRDPRGEKFVRTLLANCVNGLLKSRELKDQKQPENCAGFALQESCLVYTNLYSISCKIGGGPFQYFHCCKWGCKAALCS